MGGIWKGDKAISVHAGNVYNAPSKPIWMPNISKKRFTTSFDASNYIHNVYYKYVRFFLNDSFIVILMKKKRVK